MIRSAALAAGLSMLFAWGPAAAQPALSPHPGEPIYRQACASCHDSGEAMHAPSKANLQAMSYQTLEFALTQGKMKGQGAGLTDETRAQLITYLTGKTAGMKTAGANWADRMMCPANRRGAERGAATIAGFGYDKANTRALSARQAGLTKAQLSNMELAWSIAIPDATTMRSQPAVVGKTVFLPVADAGVVYAFDVSVPAKPCVKWLYKAGGPLRTSAAYGVIADGRGVLAVGGQEPVIHLIDAATGKAIWTRKVGTFTWSLTTGVPTILKDRIIVPVAQYEISYAGDNKQKCCDNHGYVLSLDPRTGELQWRYDTMEDAKPLRDRGDGKMVYGPSGAPIWNSPSVDEKRGLIYFGTGEANSPPVSVNTDAVIAIGLKDGKERWAMQATARDIYTIGCGPNPPKERLNCFGDTVFRDADFGASMILARLPHGTDVVVAGQKAGTVFGFEPGSGKLLWRTPLGTGGALGGVHWGMAYADNTVFAPVSAVGRNLAGEPVDVNTIKSGLYALDATTGAIRWNYASAADCSGDRVKRAPTCARHYGFSTAPTVIDGAVVAASLDGFVYVFDGKDGKVLWKYDTAQPYTGLNGVAGRGGSIDAVSITAANGLLLVNSGYGLWGQQAGNMILAFKPR
ncbi:MAG: hypothetical protein EON88_16155 [Brevundimonas sp.]|nr:MAG: hypothetical protein EON88_16155 [Brevundimonas sp.]